ncbi:MAG: YcxB family protein [Streptosporangiales bacterium]|nr:YcxB family protein [Streptosporangiales bacterium]MBO0889385.1 YcxB family protein [Acidothermales bacterium]
MDERLDLDWTPRPGDWPEAMAAMYPAVRWRWLLVVALVVAAVFAATNHLVALTAVAVVLAAATYLLPYLPAYLAFSRNPVASQHIEASVDGDGVDMALEDARQRLPWSAFAAWHELRHSFVLRMGTGRRDPSMIIPKRAFPADRHQELRDLLTRYIAPCGQHRTP